MEERESIICIEDTSSSTFQAQCGLLQGSPVSPILFLRAMEDGLRLSIGRFGYVDDVAIFALAPSLPECAHRL